MSIALQWAEILSNAYSCRVKAAHTGTLVQDRKQCDASQTPAGGTDSTMACTESCRRKGREALRDRSQGSHSKNKSKSTRAKKLQCYTKEKCHAYKHLEADKDTNVYMHWYTHIFFFLTKHFRYMHVAIETWDQVWERRVSVRKRALLEQYCSLHLV